MTDNSKPEQTRPDETDPLSATAMFLRALDHQSEAKQSKPPTAKLEPAAPTGIPGFTPDSRPVSGRGEFTETFGKSNRAQSSSEHPISTQPLAAEQPPSAGPLRPTGEPAGTQAPGEFTQIFVKDAAPPSKSRAFEERRETSPFSPTRPRGFSSPGVSDAASGETSFSQIFKPVQGAKVAGGPASRPEAARASTPIDSPRNEMPFGRAADSPNAAKSDPSITSLIESLSSPPAASGLHAAEPAPYRPNPLDSYQPLGKPAPPSDLALGGVTRFIQRLSDPLVAQPVPPPAPIHVPNQSESEYTRIISAPPNLAIETPIAPVPPRVQAPSPEISFARPAAPAVPANPIHVANPPATVPAVPVFMAPPVPSPHLPPAPAAPAVAAPKGKLEAIVPMLLVVNTFLLVIILVVMIFLIKSR
jgi:hypothetical protein